MRKPSWGIALIIGISYLSSAQTARVRLINISHAETLVSQPDVKAVAKTSLEIKKERPEIPSKVLVLDAELIDQAIPAVQTEFRKAGFNDDDVVEASLVAWKEVRLNSPLQPTKLMDRESFVEFVTTSVGKVVFKSNPDQARITVGTEHLGPTELKKWYPKGTLTVLFEKDGFDSVKRTCDVKAPGSTECTAELKPKPK